MAQNFAPLILLAASLAAQTITSANVQQLEVAWRFSHGELGPADPSSGRRPSFSATPILAEGKLFVITPTGSAVALDPDSGKVLWRWSSGLAPRRSWGASYAKGRLFFGTPDGHLICLLARNGELLWKRNLLDGLSPGHLSQNMPPFLIGDLVVTSGEVPEGVPQGPEAALHAWRQSDGSPAWTFHTIPQDGQPGADTWAPGSRKNRTGVNVWGQCAADEAAGILFCPTGSASYDYYGGDRHGSNLHANSVLALEGKTGRLLWAKQLVHHDIWDYDLPAKPVLLDLKRNGQTIPALVQVTKMGFLWFLDRRNGTAIFGEDERPAPASTAPGEQTWPTQPWPRKPAPLARTSFTEKDLNTLTPAWAAECRALYAQIGPSGIFAPWGTEKLTLIFPGTLGGGTWSGASFDPISRLLFVNANELGAVGKLEQNKQGEWRRTVPNGNARFATKDGVPCQLPPWNTLNAIHVDTGDTAWRVPLGELPQAKSAGIANTGAYGLGGSLALPNGLVFIAGSHDAHFRAFDSKSGKTLWQTELPATAYATPMSWTSGGHEYIALAVGGGSFFPGPVTDQLIVWRIKSKP